eukprot:6207835-Pleurochrysis_carterae.AAC.8
MDVEPHFVIPTCHGADGFKVRSAFALLEQRLMALERAFESQSARVERVLPRGYASFGFIPLHLTADPSSSVAARGQVWTCWLDFALIWPSYETPAVFGAAWQITAEQVREQVDEKTIGVICVLGNHYGGQYDPASHGGRTAVADSGEA